MYVSSIYVSSYYYICAGVGPHTEPAHVARQAYYANAPPTHALAAGRDPREVQVLLLILLALLVQKYRY
jgi:hypothetical protein